MPIGDHSPKQSTSASPSALVSPGWQDVCDETLAGIPQTEVLDTDYTQESRHRNKRRGVSSRFKKPATRRRSSRRIHNLRRASVRVIPTSSAFSAVGHTDKGTLDFRAYNYFSSQRHLHISGIKHGVRSLLRELLAKEYIKIKNEKYFLTFNGFGFVINNLLNCIPGNMTNIDLVSVLTPAVEKIKSSFGREKLDFDSVYNEAKTFNQLRLDLLVEHQRTLYEYLDILELQAERYTGDLYKERTSYVKSLRNLLGVYFTLLNNPLLPDSLLVSGLKEIARNAIGRLKGLVAGSTDSSPSRSHSANPRGATIDIPEQNSDECESPPKIERSKLGEAAEGERAQAESPPSIFLSDLLDLEAPYSDVKEKSPRRKTVGSLPPRIFDPDRNQYPTYFPHGVVKPKVRPRAGSQADQHHYRINSVSNFITESGRNRVYPSAFIHQPQEKLHRPSRPEPDNSRNLDGIELSKTDKQSKPKRI
ncbi:MAG: hypothetical protein CMF48_07225 [Legionellales bacterium]|nr:hypothetical protein [Legionellales bacterium]|tara:strand:+ start:514 stop:1941 length:1428 start_codon:yes stop_codon:yes gene_type:complete